ncbi:OmpA family protein [Zavarzinia compransoris]|uniref:OmpA family protein n=1 Tax=Zavarzinia marina TaxID=2911065 RepID=UPI001F1BA5EE|nr:OmpA family protein [Zavarzinia marina]MCF4164242.1 OmpA family protein [Zavarzinia marina]
MRLSLGLVSAAAILVAGTAAHADRVGPYLSAFGGYVTQPLLDFESPTPPGAVKKMVTDDGWAAGGAMGYDFGRIRVEAEVSYRENEASRIQGANATGDLSALALMLNALYDLENSSRFTPYIGAGIGAAWVYTDKIRRGTPASTTDDDVQFAYQGIVGVKAAITTGLSLFVDYRYFATLDPTWSSNAFGSVDGEYASHNIMAGLSYNFGTGVVPVAEPAPAPAPAPEPAIVRSYIVFFDWDSVAITPEANAIIMDAANAAKTLGTARIELTGHADRSGPPLYNQRLSVRRAEAVKSVLMGLGIAPEEIVTIGKGESAPLVPTPDGVREPQNRRVEIVLQ